MKESLAFVGGPELIRNSLILTGLPFLTFSAIVSVCFLLVVAFVHRALPTRSPFKAPGPDVTLNVALTLAPGATGSANVFDVSEVPATRTSMACRARKCSTARLPPAPRSYS